MYDHIITRQPIDWRSDFVLVAGLEGIDHAQNLGGVAASARRVGHDESDLLVWVDDEDTADCEGDALLVHVRGVLVIDPVIALSVPVANCAQWLIRVYSHVIQQRDFPLLVTNDREPQLAARDLIDVLDPPAMAVDGVRAYADELDTTLRELWLELRESAELSCTHRRLLTLDVYASPPLSAQVLT